MARQTSEIIKRLQSSVGATTLAALAQFLQITPTSVNGAIRKQQIPDAWLYKVAYRTGRSVEWLRTGKGPEYHIVELVAEDRARYGPPGIPVLAKIPAGPFRSALNLFPYPGAAEEYLQIEEPGQSLIALRVHGTSMIPEFQDGDYVVVRIGGEAQTGDLVVVQDDDEEGTFKRLVKKQDGAELHPFNPEHTIIHLTHRHRIVGKVIRLIRSF